jgi:hypothetical protein
MAEENLLDDDLRALDLVAEERGAAGLGTTLAAVDRMRQEGDRDRLMCALPPLARSFALCEKFEEAESAANEALAHFRVSGSVRGQAFALNALGVVAVRRGVPSRALEVAGEAVVLARAAEDPILQVRIANTLGVVLNDMGHPSEAVQIFEKGLRAARGFPGEAVVLRLRSDLSLALARWALKEYDDRVPEASWRPRAERAIELMEPTLRTWREEKKWAEICNALDHLAISHIVLGDLVAAHVALDEAESLMDASALHSMVFFSCARAHAYLHAKEPQLALQALERGRVAADSRGGHMHMDELLRLKSLANELRGEWQEALVSHKRFDELRSRLVLDRAEQQSSALVVALSTERALRQVSEERDRAERAHLEARHDQLTGLANRRRFDEFLAGVPARASTPAPGVAGADRSRPFQVHQRPLSPPGRRHRVALGRHAPAGTVPADGPARAPGRRRVRAGAGGAAVGGPPGVQPPARGRGRTRHRPPRRRHHPPERRHRRGHRAVRRDPSVQARRRGALRGQGRGARRRAQPHPGRSPRVRVLKEHPHDDRLSTRPLRLAVFRRG